MALVILFIYFASAILHPSAAYSKNPDLNVAITTDNIADIRKEVNKLVNKYPDDMGYRFGFEVAKGLFLPIITALRCDLKNKDESQKYVLKEKDDQIKEKDKEIYALRLPVELRNKINRFFDMYASKVSLTTKEEMIISNITDTHKKTRLRLVNTCEHALTDLNTDYDISELNKEIDLAEHENLSKLSKAERIKIVCKALVYVKFYRNAEVHEVFLSGPRIKKIKILLDDACNEGLVAFIDAHKTGVLNTLRVKYEI